MSEESMNQEPVEVEVEPEAQPATSQQAQDSKPPVPQNYLVFAILSTIFCCMPLGIPAIIFASQVNTKYVQGDYAGAEDASQKAKMWCFISFGVGLLLTVLYFASMLLSMVLGAASK